MPSFPSLAVIVEWDNARLSEIGRAREMLKALRAQLTALEPAPAKRPELLILYDPAEVERSLVERTLDDAAAGSGLGANAWPADIRIEAAPGRAYYEQKNLGVRLTSGELVVFLDSDVIPEDGWLNNLLRPFADPAVQVVGGNTYLAVNDLYSKAFALFWFFPVRTSEDRLVRVRRFFANNVVFRREVIEAHPFPQLPTFRGQCRALADRLAAENVPIHLQTGSRVSHPAPNGFRHFLNRALCEGHDERFLWALPGHAKIMGTPLGSCVRFVHGLGRALVRTARHHRAVGLGPLQILGAFGLAAIYYSLRFAGEMTSFVRPGLIRDRFAV